MFAVPEERAGHRDGDGRDEKAFDAAVLRQRSQKGVERCEGLDPRGGEGGLGPLPIFPAEKSGGRSVFFAFGANIRKRKNFGSGFVSP